MRFRKLRIAFSVTCLMACVLLIVLWVRSYKRVESLCLGTSSGNLSFASYVGRLQVLVSGVPAHSSFGSQKMDVIPTDVTTWAFNTESVPFRLIVAAVPFWFPVLLSATFAAMPWIRYFRRFSVRTLLIATTLVAIVLGLVVWATRQ
jgi:hypothetical protein